MPLYSYCMVESDVQIDRDLLIYTINCCTALSLLIGKFY